MEQHNWLSEIISLLAAVLGGYIGSQVTRKYDKRIKESKGKSIQIFLKLAKESPWDLFVPSFGVSFLVISILDDLSGFFDFRSFTIIQRYSFSLGLSLGNYLSFRRIAKLI